MRDESQNDARVDLEDRETQEQNRLKAIEFARNYEVFVNDPRGRELLEHWNKTLLRKRTPANSSLQQYAFDEATRAFIHGIHDQIELARSARD